MFDLDGNKEEGDPRKGRKGSMRGKEIYIEKGKLLLSWVRERGDQVHSWEAGYRGCGG